MVEAESFIEEEVEQQHNKELLIHISQESLQTMGMI